MAVPKRRVSSARRDKRRSNVWKMEAPELQKCPNCGEYKRAHRVCPACGMYNGRQVLSKKEEESFILYLCLSVKRWRRFSSPPFCRL